MAVKWFTPEVLQAEAQSLRTLTNELISVDYTIVEVASALVRKTHAGIYRDAALAEDLRALTDFMDYYLATDLLGPASRVAIAHHRSVYDSLYVALALQESCQLVTADQRLYNSLSNVYPGTLLWLGDVTASTA